MTVIGPFRLLRELGAYEAGKVWSAFSADGMSVTVAMIDPRRAGNPAWLESFRAGTDNLVRAGVLSVVDADLNIATPWVACAWDDGIGAARLFVELSPPPVEAAAAQPGGAAMMTPVVARARVVPAPAVAPAAPLVGSGAASGPVMAPAPALASPPVGSPLPDRSPALPLGPPAPAVSPTPGESGPPVFPVSAEPTVRA